MKSIIKKGSCKLGGLIFKHKDVTCMTPYEWKEAGFPSDVYIFASPDFFYITGIPIVDAFPDYGVFHKTPVRPMKECKYKVPWYLCALPAKQIKKHHVEEGIAYTNVKALSENVKFHR